MKEQKEALQDEAKQSVQDQRDYKVGGGTKNVKYVLKYSYLQETLSRRRLMLAFMFFFFFFYGCLEFTIISFLSTFGVNSALDLSYKEAATLMAYYLGPLLAMRIIAIILERHPTICFVKQSATLLPCFHFLIHLIFLSILPSLEATLNSQI